MEATVRYAKATDGTSIAFWTIGAGEPLVYLAGVYVIGISAAYVGVYWAFGERIFARANPWVNTARPWLRSGYSFCGAPKAAGRVS